MIGAWMVRGASRRPLQVLSVLLCLSSAHAVDYGDTYVDSSIGDAVVLNPILSSDSASNDLIGLIYNGLVKYDKDLNIVGDLAESYEVRRGGLELIFHLRHNVRWHDGQPFTAEDVLFTYQKLIDPKVLTPYGDSFADVQTVTSSDPYTVRVVYKEPFSPGLISWAMGIVPKHVYAIGDFNTHPANRKPIGTGPYRFKEWKSDQYVLLEANADSFEGKPTLSRYVYRIIPDQAVQFMEMRNQSIDNISLTPDQFKAYDAMFQNHQRYRYPAFKYVFMGFNLLNPLFKDLRVRKALALGIDRETIVKGILLGLGQPISGPFAISSWAYDKTIPPPPYDPEEARRLLREAGWIPDAHGRLYKDGKPFSFTLITNQGNKVRALCAEIIQQQLSALGIDVQVRVIEWSTFIKEYVDKKNFEAVVLGWSTGRDPDHYGIWHSSQQKPGQYNFCSYSNPDVDRLLVAGRREFDPKKRETIYHQIHRLIANDLPYVFLYCPDELQAIHKRIQGPTVAPAGIGWNFREWWVPKAKQRYRTELVP
jgi:peptide/nickel transport system substrate-binding protein